MCDIIARGKRMRGFDTYFLTGLDEHGEKIEDNAKAAGVTPQELRRWRSPSNSSIFGRHLQISNDDFIRTTQPRHYETVQKIFSRFMRKK
jgi:methionyl-tRNA synthetase